MYAVIFKAKIKTLDSSYSTTAARLRELALAEYGCTEFTACTEGQQEIAISYWPSLAHIKAWGQDPEHRQAQALGKAKWYESYQVQITQIVEPSP
ncbi:antibiotic biosynthesis monooxygenase [Motiliproteus sp. SC1-56]|uniref:antibiotic biosynthesis monooxygenase family protein n=1 Tax=Motiliproteus sp. SC1-56 TaxID=2799565 RepID=UPI001A8E763D|nr:antibiotic biosynthesis monooxygenase [Motiliproteus sp. SC1-56]